MMAYHIFKLRFVKRIQTTIKQTFTRKGISHISMMRQQNQLRITMTVYFISKICYLYQIEHATFL